MKMQFMFITTLALGLCAGQAKMCAVENPVAPTEWTPQAEAQFYQQLNEELAKEHKDILNLENQVIQKKQGFGGDFKKEFQDKINSLVAKKTLYEKFQQAPSLQYPAVRAKLLEIFQKPVIEEKDLQELQAVIDLAKSGKQEK